jgi:hypothetical protein
MIIKLILATLLYIILAGLALFYGLKLLLIIMDRLRRFL